MTKRRTPKASTPSVATNLTHEGTLESAYARNGKGSLQFEDGTVIAVVPATGAIAPAALIGVQQLHHALEAGEHPHLRVEYAEVTGQYEAADGVMEPLTRRFASKIEVLP